MGHLKAVDATWGLMLDGPAFRLLSFIVRWMPDRELHPRCELSPEFLAFGLGYATLDSKSRRALSRAVAKLVRVGALELAQKPGPNQRSHYIVHPLGPMERRTDVSTVQSTVDSETVDTSVAQRWTDVSTVDDDTLSSSYQDSKTGHGTNGEYDGKPRARRQRAERPLRLVPPPTAANGHQASSIAAQAAVKRARAHIERSDVDVDTDAGMRNDGRRDTDELAY